MTKTRARGDLAWGPLLVLGTVVLEALAEAVEDEVDLVLVDMAGWSVFLSFPMQMNAPDLLDVEVVELDVVLVVEDEDDEDDVDDVDDVDLVEEDDFVEEDDEEVVVVMVEAVPVEVVPVDMAVVPVAVAVPVPVRANISL